MKKYLKGQLHLHTAFSDGTWPLSMIADAYKERGYDFIFLTDHGINYNPYDYIKKQKDFLVIPGSEVGTEGYNKYLGKIGPTDLNALGFLGQYNNPKTVKNSIYKNQNNHIEEIYRVGAIPTINHPHWNYTDPFCFDYKNLLEVKYPFILEPNP